MARYRKKPVVIEAERTPWSVEPNRLAQFCPEFGLTRRWFRRGAWLKTLEGWMRVTPGDFIITGIQGERYPCKPDIFEATYELVGDYPGFTEEQLAQIKRAEEKEGECQN